MNLNNLVKRWFLLANKTMDIAQWFDDIGGNEELLEDDIRAILMNNPKDLIDFYAEGNFIFESYPEYVDEFISLAQDTLKYVLINGLYK